MNGRSHGGSGWGGYPPAEDGRAWRQIYRHAEWLGLDFCRVELEQRIYEPERGQFTWDSPEMRIFYRILDWCERRHVDVFLQQMWGNVDWNAWPEFRGDAVKRVHSGPYSMCGVCRWIGHAPRALDQDAALHLHPLALYQQRAGIRLVVVAAATKSTDVASGRARRCAPGPGPQRHFHPLSGPDKTDLPDLIRRKLILTRSSAPMTCTLLCTLRLAGYERLSADGGGATAGEWAKWAHERGKPLFLSELGTMAFGWNGSHPGPSTFEAALKDAELVVRGLNLGVDGFNRWSFINRGDLDGHWEMISTWDEQSQSARSLLRSRTPISSMADPARLSIPRCSPASGLAGRSTEPIESLRRRSGVLKEDLPGLSSTMRRARGGRTVP